MCIRDSHSTDKIKKQLRSCPIFGRERGFFFEKEKNCVMIQKRLGFALRNMEAGGKDYASNEMCIRDRLWFCLENLMRAPPEGC